MAAMDRLQLADQTQLYRAICLELSQTMGRSSGNLLAIVFAAAGDASSSGLPMCKALHACLRRLQQKPATVRRLAPTVGRTVIWRRIGKWARQLRPHPLLDCHFGAEVKVNRSIAGRANLLGTPYKCSRREADLRKPILELPLPALAAIRSAPSAASRFA